MSTEKKPESGYDFAYRLVREQLGKIADLTQQCLRSGARCVSAQKVIIDYLHQSYEIALPGAEISPVAWGQALSLREKILVLHYFTRATGTPLSHRVIAYQELPDGANYLPVFRKRAIKPLLDHFGSEPERLLGVAAVLGGRRADYGDVAVTVSAFPMVPVSAVLWKGDDEFPPDGKMMFDSTISEYLTTDDINVLCETIAWRLVRLKAAQDGRAES